MPKKITRDYKIKRRNIWKSKSAKRSSDEKRVVNNIYIGAGNAERWIVLKKRLDYASDKDFVSYLLDLADPTSVSNKPEELAVIPSRDEEIRTEQPKPNGVAEDETNDIDSYTRSPYSSPQDGNSDDGEWRPVGNGGQLRRSPRKQSKSLRIHVRRSNRTSQTEKRVARMHKKKKRKSRSSVDVGESGMRELSVVLEAVDGPPTLRAEPEVQEFREAEREMPTLQAGGGEEEFHTAPVDPPAVVVEPAPDPPADVHIEVGERVKLKRREKRRRHTDEAADVATSSSKHSGRHKRKKHKHGEHGTKRKHHDIRKAPHAGVCSPPTPPPAPPPEREPTPPPPAPVQRINAIKIKLCSNCNTRHLQDACPLQQPAMIVEDALSIEEWRAREQPTKVEGVEADTYSVASLPQGLELQAVDPEHGLSVMATVALPQFSRLGPLVGQPIREMDIPDDFNMKDIWETTTSTERTYMSTVDPNSSNWLRYLRPAASRDQRNLAAVVRDARLWFYTVTQVAPGQELLYWADHAHSVWSKKKMEKTNCGGCNLHFSHPIYYRLHCAVFHDPNFSLTIRKYHCKVCGVAVLGKENIMRHASEQHDGKGAYRCQFCNKFFLRLNYLEMHRTYGCAANPQRTRPLCDFCGRKFCQPQKLKVHIKRMHSDMAEVLREFQCKICMKLLGSRAALQRHMKEVHHKDIVGACTCDRCGKMFQNKSNLKIHMLTHSGVKPFKCRESPCSAAFTTKQCLQFHYKKVHSFSEMSMPAIERSVAYTFDAYSGGVVEDPNGAAVTGSAGRRAARAAAKNARYDDEEDDDDSLLSAESSSSSLTNAADASSSNSSNVNNCREEEDGPPRLSPPHATHAGGGVTPKQPPTLDAYPPPYKTPPLEPYPAYDKPEDENEDESYVQPIYKVANKVVEPLPSVFKSHKTIGNLDSYSYKGGVSPRDDVETSYYKAGMSPQSEAEPVYYKGPVSPREEEEPSYYKAGMSPRQDVEAAYYKGGVSPRQDVDDGYYKGGVSPRQDMESAYYKGGVSPRQDVESGYYGKVLSKASKKWMPELSPRSPTDDGGQIGKAGPRELYDFPEEKCSVEIVKLAESGVEGLGKSKLRVKPLSSFHRPDSSTASLLVEAALDAAQRDIITDAGSAGSVIAELPTQLDNIRESPLDYMHESSPGDGVAQHHRLSPEPSPAPPAPPAPMPQHLHMDAYMQPQQQRCTPPEHYMRHEDDYSLHYHEEVMSPSGTPRSHVEYSSQEMASPSVTPSPRYQLQPQVDGLSSDEEGGGGGLVAQNLTKEKAALQLYAAAAAAAAAADDEHGLDMSRSAPYHPFNAPLPPRYHLYDDRYSPPAYPEVLRVVSLDLTPGRHSVDLSLPRSSHHHPHHHLHQPRMLASPPPPGPPPPDQGLMSPPGYPSYLPPPPPSPRATQPQPYHHYSAYY